MDRPILRPGDEFATCNPMALGALINIVQRAGAVDNESTYTHAGIITKVDGTTLEALWSVKSQNIWTAYRGKRVLIARNINMDPVVCYGGLRKVAPHVGQWYPFHRLAFHLLGLAKWIHWRRLVCSELAAKFETGCAEYIERLDPDRATGFLRNYHGVNPDDLADRWRMSKYYTIIFEGVIE